MQLTSLAGKRIIDVAFSYRYALPFKKSFEETQRPLGKKISEELYAKFRSRDVDRFFRDPEISRLHPIPLTALFVSLHPEILKEHVYVSKKVSKIIEKIAIHFFSSQSTAKGLEGRVHIYGPMIKEKWNAINQNPADFFVKLSLLVPSKVKSIIYYTLKAGRHPLAEEIHSFNEGCLRAIKVYTEWLIKNDPIPDTLRPIDDYSKPLEAMSGDLINFQKGVVFAAYGEERYNKIYNERKSF